VGYLFQKILVNRRRRTGKRANDVLYVADTADIFGDRLDGLREEWLNTVGPQIHPKHIRKFRGEAAGLVAPRDAHIEASRITDSIGRVRSPDLLAQTIRSLVEQVFPAGSFES
jgi:hypothetical protein